MIASEAEKREPSKHKYGVSCVIFSRHSYYVNTFVQDDKT